MLIGSPKKNRDLKLYAYWSGMLIYRMLSDNQVTVACATLGKLCQISLLPLRTEHHRTSSDINTINLLNLNS
jgi:hypothetical protein